MQVKFFEIDFLKFLLTIAMVFRHSPLYIYSERVTEYSIESLNIYSLLIPVTSGFIFILGYTLASSYAGKVKNNNSTKINIKYIKLFLLLLILSIVFSLITYFRNEVKIDFTSYYLTYMWNTNQKPGFYILFPISLIYLVNYIQYSFGKKYIVEAFTFISIILLISVDLYFLHYLVFGLLGYVAGLNLDFKKILSKVNIFTFLLANILYFSIFFIGYKNDINFLIELYLLILFISISIGLSKYINFQKYDPINKIILISSKNILPFYILHVIGLQFLTKFLSFESLLTMSIFSLLYFMVVMLFIYQLRTFLKI